MGEARDDARADRVAAGGKHYWDVSSCPLGGEACWRARGDDEVDLVIHQFFRKTRKAVELAVSIEVFGLDRATFDVAKLAHSASVFIQEAVPLRLRSGYKPPDPRDTSGILLRQGARYGE